MEGISLGSAFLRLYGDRSALDRELEKLKRYTDYLEKQGIKVKFDADTGQATREVNGLQNRLFKLQETLNQVGRGVRGDGDAWQSLSGTLAGLAGKAAESGGAMGKMGSMLGTAGAAATKAIPILGQLGMAAMGVQAIFQGVSAAINGVIAPLAALSKEAGRFNQQVAEASIFATNSFAVIGPDGQAIQGTANQMRALRGTISKEYKEIQKEVAQISGATASQIYDGFNIILQNVGALGKEGEDLSNVRKLATRLAAGMNTLNVPGEQLRSEMTSLLTGDVQMYDKLGRDLYGPNASQTIRKLQAEGKYYEDLMGKLEKLYDGQKVLSESLVNVQSNFTDVFETISTEGGQALERGLAKSFKAVLDPLNALQGAFAGFVRGTNEFLEPIMKILGEIGGWFVSAGSAIASTLQVVMDILALGANVIGSVLGPALRTVGKVLTVVAKSFELVAALVSAVIRPITTFFRILGDQGNEDVDNIFEPIIEGLDKLIGLANKASQIIARPFVEAAKWTAWLRGKASGKSDQQIKGEQDEIESAFADAIGSSRAPDLRSLKLQRPTEDLLNELSQRYGSGSQRQLQIAKETSQLVQDRVKNEITGLEQAIKLLQTQKGLQESMNQLADARRGLAMSRASFSVQVAGSPEARLAAEERRNELAARQEQERINERRALLGTERQLLQMQLELQVKQQRIQQEQLKLQRLEIQIQRDKAVSASKDVALKLNNAAPRSKEYQALREQWRLVGQEIELRTKQLKIMDRTVSLSFEAEAGARRTNAIEQKRLGVQGQILDVQGQSANLTLKQQQTLSRLQSQEQQLRNRLAAEQGRRNERLKDLQEETESIQRQEQLQKKLQDLERARLETKKAAADAEVQAAERQLRAVQARDSASTGRDYLAAQIEAIVAGTRGYVTEAEATRRLYDAKDQQLALEQQMQREQLRIQQERERSELRIAQIQNETEELRALNLQAEMQFRRQQLGLQQQRDTLSGAPSAPVLPPPTGGIANMLPGTKGGPNFNDGVGYIPRRGRNHNGQDLGLDVGDPIHARRKGVVRQAYSTGFGTVGGAVVIGYDDGTQGTYGHVNPGVRAGQAIAAGQRIATVTPDGQNTHLHYELRNGFGQLLNPLNAIKESLRVEAGQTAAGTAQAPTSLANDLLQNSNDLVRVEETLSRIRKQGAELTREASATEERLNEQTKAQRISQSSVAAQQAADRLRAQLTAEILNSFKGRLATSLSDAFVTGVSGAIRGVMTSIRGGQSVGDAINSALERMADQAFEALLSAALKPMEDALYNNLLKGLLGDELNAAEQQVIAQQEAAAQSHQNAAQAHQNAAQALNAAAGAIGAAAGAKRAGSSGGDSSPNAQDLPDTPYGSTDTSATNVASSSAEAAAAWQQSAETGKKTAEDGQALRKSMSAATQAFGAVALAINGIEQLGKGGTYNVLMGLSSIFGSIGMITGMFGTGGIFGPAKKATGGPVFANTPYVVGEIGPELFVPNGNGTIIPTARTQALLASRSALGSGGQSESSGMTALDASRSALAASAALTRERQATASLTATLSAPAQPLNVSYESRVINNVEYVTAEQFQRGVMDAAERGRALTLGALKNSVKARRQVGI